MKRILITITLVLASLIGFGQLNLDDFNSQIINKEGKRGKSFGRNINEYIDRTVRDNSSIDINNIMIYDLHEFLNGRKFTFIIFNDKSGKFLDIIFLSVRERVEENGEEIVYPYLIHRLHDAFYYDEDREFETIGSNSNEYAHSFKNGFKIKMSDGSYILISYKELYNDKSSMWHGEISVIDYYNDDKYRNYGWLNFLN